MPLTFCLDQNDNCCNPNIVNASITRGESVIYQFAFTENGTTPFDFTDYSARMQIGFPTPLLLATGGPSDYNLEIDIPTNGIVLVNISEDVVNNFPVGIFPYDFFTFSSNNQSIRWFGGSFTVNQAETPIP